MARNFLRSCESAISGLGKFVASLSPFGSAAPEVGSRIPGLANLKRSLGAIFSEEDGFSDPEGECDEDEEDNCIEGGDQTLKNLRCSRREYWDRITRIECIVSDLAKGCRCGDNCLSSMTIGAVERNRTNNAARNVSAQKDHVSRDIAAFKQMQAVKYHVCILFRTFHKLLFGRTVL